LHGIEGLKENIPPQLKVYFSYRPPYWVLYRWCNVCVATVELVKFVSPWLFYRIIWVPTTRRVFRILTTRHHYSPCEASTILNYFNPALGCLALFITLIYNSQLPWLTNMIACWSVNRFLAQFIIMVIRLAIQRSRQRKTITVLTVALVLCLSVCRPCLSSSVCK